MFDATMTQAVRHIRQSMHTEACTKQDEYHERSWTGYGVMFLLHFAIIIVQSVSLYCREIFRFVYHGWDCNWYYHESELGYIAINVLDNTPIYPNLLHPL